MRSLPVGPLLGAALALTACADPELAISVRYEDPGLAPDLDDRGPLRSLTLAVIELPPHPDGSPVTCAEVRYGRISRDQLDGGRRTSASVLSGRAGLSGVPRLGEKLFVLDGRDVHGDRIAGGCLGHGDIEGDVALTVEAEIAPKIRVVGQRGVPRDPSAPPDDFDLGVYQPWPGDDGVVGLGGRVVEVDLRDRVADRAQIATATSCGDAGPACVGDIGGTGFATVPLMGALRQLTPALQPGPVEVTVRAPWAETPLVVRAFQPLEKVADAAKLLGPTRDSHNQAAPSWAVVRNGGLRAAALYVTGGDTPVYRIVVFSANDQYALNRHEIIADEPIRSLVAWHDQIWTRAASGWRQVDLMNYTLGAAIGGVGVAATEMIAVAPCVGQQTGQGPPHMPETIPDGILIRSGDGPYAVYDGPNQPHTETNDVLAAVTADVNRLDDRRVLSTVCMTYPGFGLRRTVVVRGQLPPTIAMPDPTVGTYLIRSGMTTGLSVSPIGAGFVGYSAGGETDLNDWRLAGAALDVTGPRLASFALTTQQFFGGDDGRLDGDLTTLPASTSVADLDGDKAIDVVATAHEIVDESRIQVTYLAKSDRPALTGLSPPFRGVAPRVALERLPMGQRYVAMVATSEVVAVFYLEAR